MSALRPSWTSFLLASVAGCAIAPERSYEQALVDTPERWSAAATAEPFEAQLWWREFEDVDLSALVEEALVHNRDLGAAAARVDAALAQATIAGAARKPTVNLGYDVTRSRQNFIGLPVGGGAEVLSNEFTSQGVSLDAAWELDLWGKLAAGKKAAGADLGAAQVELRGARLSIAGQTVKAWLGLVEARLQLDLAEETARSFRSNTDFVRRRYSEGRADPLDLRFLESDLASAEALVAAARDDQARARRQLEILLGRYPEGAVESALDLPSMPAAPPAGLPSELLLRRPDLVAAELRLEAADHRLYEARAQLYPSISLTGSAGRRALEFEDLFDSSFDVWSIAAQVLQPVYAGGRLRAEIELADARAREVLAGYAQSILQAFGEVENALVSEELLANREASLTVASEQAMAAWQMSQERYHNGLVDVITVLTSQRRAVEVRSQLLRIRRARLQNRVDLHLSLGGDFDRARETDTQVSDADAESEGASEPEDRP